MLGVQQAHRPASHPATFRPGDPGYDEARRPFRLTVDQSPAEVVRARSADDVVSALRSARERDLPFAVQATGHGLPRGCTGGVLVNLRGLSGVSIEGRVARVGGGTLWREVLQAAGPVGLVGASGTGPTVAVTGYTLGGGVGLLARTLGFASDHLVAAEVVTAVGERIRTSSEEHPALFRALRGGGGNFGVVTSLEFLLHAIPEVHGGILAWPGERAHEVLAGWADWTLGVPDEVTSMAILCRTPDLPHLPEAIRGRPVVMVRATGPGRETEWVDRLRRALGPALMDTFRTCTYLEAALSGMEPEDPVPVTMDGGLLGELTPRVLEILVDRAGPHLEGGRTEIRHLGGALRRSPATPDVVCHRDAAYVFSAGGLTPTAESVESTRRRLDGLLAELAPHRHPGTLLNWLPGLAPEERVREAYTPAVWGWLREVKREYDPDNVFRCTHTIPPAS